MLKTSMTVALAALTLVACGGSSPVAQTSTVERVSVQPGDLPSGMVKCNLSGDINHFIQSEQTPDPKTSSSMAGYWNDAKKIGAIAAYVAFYSDSQAHCTAIKNPDTNIGTATYKLVVNFVVQFKDEKSATNAYTSGSIFGFSPSQLKTGGAQPLEGTKTGLTPNSIVLSVELPPQSYYIAVWQNKTLMVILALLNVDAGAGKNAAAAENGRIK